MAFPAVAARASSTVNAETTSHTVSLPADIASGDLLVVFFANKLSATTTWPSGWTELAGGNHTLHMAYRRADGTEGSTISVTTSVSRKSAHLAWRITGHHTTSDPEAAKAAGISATPDPPSLTPTWGAEDNLYLAGASTRNGGTFSAYPANYIEGRFSVSTGGGAADNTACGGAERALNASPEDPGAFTFSVNDAWNSATFAIRPAAAPAAAVRIPSRLLTGVGLAVGG